MDEARLVLHEEVAEEQHPILGAKYTPFATGTPSRSAWSCIMRLLAAAPPSFVEYARED